MPWHVRAALPGGQIAAADHRDPIAPVIRRVQHARMSRREPDPSDLEAVAAWLESHLRQSAECALGTCGHD
jgi:hypothetical protein